MNCAAKGALELNWLSVAASDPLMVLRRICCRTAVGLSFLVLLLAAAANCSAETIRWQPHADDIELMRVDLPGGVFWSPQLLLLRTTLSRYRPQVVVGQDFGRQLASVKELRTLSKASVCINANFFDEKARPLGLVVRRGLVAHSLHRGGSTLTGIFQVTRRGLSVVSRTAFRPQFVMEAFQAGPRIIVEGQPVSTRGESSTRSRRSGLCLDRRNRLILYTVASRFSGVTLPDLQGTLLRKEIGCYQALNLDGGGSAQLIVDKGLPGMAKNESRIYIRGNDDIPVALCLVSKSYPLFPKISGN